MIRISVVGPTSISIDETPVALSTSKDRAILALLAVSSLRKVNPDELIAALWQRPASKARHSLNQSLSSLRKILGPHSIRRERGSLKLDVPIETDHDTYIDLIRKKLLVEARELMRGPLLCDLTSIGSDELDEIVEEVRLRFEERVNDAVVRALQDLISSGDWPKAASLGEFAVEHHQPSRSVITLALLSSAMMDPETPPTSASLPELFNRCCDPDALGIARKRAARIAKFVRYNGRETRIRPWVVGRRHEVQTFDYALDQAVEASGSVFELVGDPGLGKTTLLRHLAFRAAIRGAVVLTLEPREAERSLGGAGLKRLLRNRYLRESLSHLPPAARRDLRRVLESNSGEQLDLKDVHSVNANRLVEIGTALFTSIARRRPTVLIVDDLPAIDPTTLQFLRELSEIAPRNRLVVVLARRTTSETSRFACAKQVFVLKPFDLQEVVEFCAQAGTGEDPEQLLVETAGHPLLLSEIVRGSNGTRSVTIDRYLQETINALSADQRALLQAAAIIGRPAGANAISRVAGLNLSLAAVHLDHLVEKDLLHSTGSDFVVAHDLLREHVVACIGPGTKELLHIRAGRVFARLRAPLALIAHHYLQSSYSRLGGKLALKAARQSERDLAFREAIELYISALPHISDVRKRAEVACRVGALCLTTGAEARGIEVLAECSGTLASAAEYRAKGELIKLALEAQAGLVHSAKELASTMEPFLQECMRGRYWRDYLGGLQTILRCADLKGDYDTVTAILPQLTAFLDACPDANVRADAIRFAGHLTSRYVNSIEGLALAHTAVRFAESISPQARLIALSTMGVVAVEAGQLRLGEQALSEAFAASEAAGHLSQRLAISNNWGVALLELGKFNDAHQKFSFVIDNARSSQRALVGTALSNCAWLSLEAEDWNSAASFARSAMQYSDLFVTIGVIARAVLGFAALEEGRIAEASRMATEVSAMQPAISGSDLSLAFMLRARMASIEGRRELAVKLLRDAVSAYQVRHLPGRLRVELALANIMAADVSAEAETMLNEVCERAARMEATRVYANAQRALGRLRRKLHHRA